MVYKWYFSCQLGGLYGTYPLREPGFTPLTIYTSWVFLGSQSPSKGAPFKGLASQAALGTSAADPATANGGAGCSDVPAVGVLVREGWGGNGISQWYGNSYTWSFFLKSGRWGVRKMKFLDVPLEVSIWMVRISGLFHPNSGLFHPN